VRQSLIEGLTRVDGLLECAGTMFLEIPTRLLEPRAIPASPQPAQSPARSSEPLPDNQGESHEADATRRCSGRINSRSCSTTLLTFLPGVFFFCFSCFSINVAAAGKMAGNARKSPPISGPKRLATIPANAVTVPPKTNRTTYSYQRDCPRPVVSSLIFTLPTSARRTNNRKRSRTTATSTGE
jgi:hypothetical protein